MPIFSEHQIKIIRIIGENGGCNSWDAPSPHRLQVLTKAYQIDRAVLTETLKSLGNNEIITITNSQKGYKQIGLTEKGISVFEAINNSAGLFSSYQEVYLETFLCADIKEDVAQIENFVVIWGGELNHWLADALAHWDVLDKSLFCCFTASQTQIFDWLAHSLLGGSYNIVLRELRHILEGLFACYFVESKNINKSLEEKAEVFINLESNRRLHGQAVFKNSGIEDWESYYATYQQLSKYVHLSRRTIEQQVNRGTSDHYEPEFSKAEFLECIDVWKVVARAAALLTNKTLELYGSNERITENLFTFYGP